MIDALLEAVGSAGTLVMPSWSDDDETPFDPDTSRAAGDLGIIAELFRTYPGVVRSDHAQAFAAVGPAGRYITDDPLPLPPHIPASPVGRVHDLDGKILLVGVGHEASSTVHLAEVLAGVRYGVKRQCTVVENGLRRVVTYLENDHCCQRFARLDGWLREAGLQMEGRVGHAPSRLVRSRDVVTLATQHLARDPLLFLHPPCEGCSDCDDARAALEVSP